MDADSEMNFTGRSLYLLNLYVFYVLKQLPTTLGISIDPEQFMQSIAFRNDTGNTIQLLDGPSAPNIGETSLTRKVSQAIWASFQQRVRRFIPHASTPASIAEVDDSELSSDLETEGDSDDE